MPQATEDTEATPGRLSNAKLNLAIDVVMAVTGISAAEVARQAGIHEQVMSTLRHHGRAGDSVQLRVLEWLDMKPSLFRPDGEPASRAARLARAARPEAA